MTDTNSAQLGKTIYDALIYGYEKDIISANEYRQHLMLSPMEGGDVTHYELIKAKNNGTRPRMVPVPFTSTR